MLKAEITDQQVTLNSSHFKKLLADYSITLRTTQALMGEAVDLDTESSPPSCIPGAVQESTGSSVDPTGSAAILAEPCVSKFCMCACAHKKAHPRDLTNNNSLI